MKKKTFKRLLTWSVGGALIFALGTYFMFDYATSYVLRSIMVSGEDASIGDTTSPTLPLEKKVVGEDNVITNNEPVKPENLQHPIGPSPDQPTATNRFTSQHKADSAKEGNNPDSAVHSNSNPTSEANTSPVVPPVGHITTEQAQKAQEEITMKEKAKVSSVLLSKLSAADIKLFMKLSENGVSAEEKKEAKKIILQKLTEEEYNELIAIAAKLGLSASGKNYQESLKE